MAKKEKRGPQPRVIQPKEKKPKKIDRKSEKVTFIDMIVRLHAASKARKAEEGERNRKQFEKTRQAVISEAQIETTLAIQFQEYVDKLSQGELKSFTMTITSEAYPYFMAMVRADKYSNLRITKIQEFQYKVRLRNSDMLI